jgi:O-antigen ligase
MSGRVFLSIVAAVLCAASCAVFLIRGPERWTDWLGVAAFGSLAISLAHQAYKRSVSPSA